MGTPFAVATERQARDLKKLKGGQYVGCLTASFQLIRRNEWVAWSAGRWRLTNAGWVALELFEALDGAKLTKIQARALRVRYAMGIWDVSTNSNAFMRLRYLGLHKDGDLTDKGLRIAKILHKYRVEV